MKNPYCNRISRKKEILDSLTTEWTLSKTIEKQFKMTQGVTSQLMRELTAQRLVVRSKNTFQRKYRLPQEGDILGGFGK